MRRSRIRRISKARLADADRRKAVREAVFARDGGCLLSPWGRLNDEGRDWGPCVGVLTPHHLLKASQGGAYSEDNLVALCAMHNSMIEDWPIQAERIGLVVRPTSAPVPAPVEAPAQRLLGDPATPCEEAGPGRLPVQYRRDPIAWAAAEGIEVWGWVQS